MHVEFLDTTSTAVTMTSTSSLVDLTGCTKLIWLKLSNKTQEIISTIVFIELNALSFIDLNFHFLLCLAWPSRQISWSTLLC
jgi:hypothetical protein